MMMKAKSKCTSHRRQVNSVPPLSESQRHFRDLPQNLKLKYPMSPNPLREDGAKKKQVYVIWMDRPNDRGSRKGESVIISHLSFAHEQLIPQKENPVTAGA